MLDWPVRRMARLTSGGAGYGNPDVPVLPGYSSGAVFRDINPVSGNRK
jgi:hypothetical protein